MTAVRTLLALIAGLVWYPGGTTLLACAGATAACARLVGPRRHGPHPSPRVAARVVGVAIVLAGIAVVALPLPASPLGVVPGAGPAALASLGIPATVAALWAADSLADIGRRPLWLATHLVWAAGLLGLGLADRTATWSSVIAHPGTAPEAARIAVAVAVAGALPALTPGPGVPTDVLGAVAWAAHAAVIAALALPGFAHWQPWWTAAAWTAVAGGLALLHATGRRLRAAGTRRGRRSPAEEDAAWC